MYLISLQTLLWPPSNIQSSCIFQACFEVSIIWLAISGWDSKFEITKFEVPTLSFQTLSFYILSFQTLSFQTLSFQTLSFQTLSFEPCNFELWNFKLWNFKLCNFKLWNFELCNFELCYLPDYFFVSNQQRHRMRSRFEDLSCQRKKWNSLQKCPIKKKWKIREATIF